MSEEIRRPTAVTFACVAAGFVGFLVLVDAVSLLSNWGSLELQRVVTSVLEEAGGAAGDVSLDTVLAWLQVGFYVVTVLAIATIVLAVYTARGDRSSRVALTALSGVAVVVLVLGGAYGLLPAIILAMVVVVLWTPEARVWFDVKNDRTPPPELVARARARMGLGAQRDRAAEVDALTGRGPTPRPDDVPPGSVPPQSQPPRVSGVAPPPPGWTPPYPYPYPSVLPPPGPRPAVRSTTPPPGVTGAAVAMLVTSLLTGFVASVIGFAYALRAGWPTWFAQEYGDPRLTVDGALGTSPGTTVDAVVAAGFGLVAVLAVVGAGVAIALLCRQRRVVALARTLALVTALAGLAAVAVIPFAPVVAFAATGTWVMLRSPVVRAWAAGRGGADQPS